MSKQSKLEAKQRVIALEYALKTPLSAFGVNSAEQVVDAANTYLKFLQGGTVEVSGFGDIWPKLHEDAARIPEIIDAEKARIEQAHIKAANLNDSGIRADRIAEGQAKTARRANEFIEVEKPSKEK
ncbi:MAG: hypothetical protein CML17_06325, partial [Pusillimonas sp.]|nr:hypothetical protein [Pusillimonas sp.]